jgi:hypothetical protein
MRKKEAQLRILAALLRVAENALITAYSVLEHGKVRQRVAALHDTLISLKTDVEGMIYG